jgi:hypothetical protein
MGRIYLYTYVTLRNCASRNPHSSPPSPFFSAAGITSSFPVFYKYTTISAPWRPPEFINEPASPFSEKEYNRTDENWTPHHAFRWIYIFV